MNTTNKILSEISAGELMDKITILEIKKMKIPDAEKQAIIQRELNSLQGTYSKCINPSKELDEQIAKLKAINLKLWDIEEGKRQHERDKNFGEKFIHLARQVYMKNDERAKAKRAINKKYGSDIVEEKSYKKY